MKNIILMVVLIVTIPTLRAQKKEIKKAHQEVKAGNFASAEAYLNQAKRIFAAADPKTRAEYYVVDAELKLAKNQLDIQQITLISNSLKLAANLDVDASIQERITQINIKINSYSATIAAREFANKNYSDAAMLYKNAYQSAQDTIHLLKAASCHLLAKEYNDAFKEYNNLINMGYTNAKTQFVATNKTTNKKDAFSSLQERNNAIAKGLYKNPEIRTSQSKLPKILRGLTMASIPIDKKHEAVAIIDRVLAKMPEDKMLLNHASHLYIQLDAIDKYNAIVDQLIKESPNDPNLYYNSAVTSTQNGDLNRAKKFYKKAIEIDPNHINAQVNLSILLIAQDKKINEELYTLTASETDNERYKALIQKRYKLYDELMPYLESIVKAQPNNKDLTKKLKNIYNFKGVNSNIAILEEEN